MFSSTAKTKENVLLKENTSIWLAEHYFNETVNLVINFKFAGQSTLVPQACLRTEIKTEKNDSVTCRQISINFLIWYVGYLKNHSILACWTDSQHLSEILSQQWYFPLSLYLASSCNRVFTSQMGLVVVIAVKPKIFKKKS